MLSTTFYPSNTRPQSASFIRGSEEIVKTDRQPYNQPAFHRMEYRQPMPSPPYTPSSLPIFSIHRNKRVNPSRGKERLECLYHHYYHCHYHCYSIDACTSLRAEWKLRIRGTASYCNILSTFFHVKPVTCSLNSSNDGVVWNSEEGNARRVFD